MKNISIFQHFSEIIRNGFIFSLLMLAIFSFSKAFANREDAISINKPLPKAKTAIEILSQKRIHETTKTNKHPAHVYRPKTPIYHQYHPENLPLPPKVMRHQLVQHPEMKHKNNDIQDE